MLCISKIFVIFILIVGFTGQCPHKHSTNLANLNILITWWIRPRCWSITQFLIMPDYRRTESRRASVGIRARLLAQSTGTHPLWIRDVKYFLQIEQSLLISIVNTPDDLSKNLWIEKPFVYSNTPFPFSVIQKPTKRNQPISCKWRKTHKIYGFCMVWPKTWSQSNYYPFGTITQKQCPEDRLHIFIILNFFSVAFWVTIWICQFNTQKLLLFG